MARAEFMVGIQDGIIQHYFQAISSEAFSIFLHYILFEWAVHHVVIRRFRVPDTETAVMFGRQTAVSHPGRFSGLSPLIAIQLCWIKNGRWCVRIGPVLIYIRRNVVMNKHTKAQ